MHLFCFGLGYSALRLAERLKNAGWNVGGTCRDPEKARALAQAGIDAHLFSDDRKLAGGVLGLASHILVSVPPGAQGDPVLVLYGRDFAECKKLRWLGYLSSTVVYGDHGGAWVDEGTEPRPTAETGRRRLKAEAAWLALHRNGHVPVHIFRLAGLYGPGRSAIDQLRRGEAKRIDKPGHVFSRIHVDDLGQVLMASMARPNPGAIYNVADDLPASAAEATAFAAELLGLEPPPLIGINDAKLSPLGRGFYADNKRIANDRIKAELGVRLRYPSYREGLSSIAALSRPTILASMASNTATSRLRSEGSDKR
jgi:nucleoside-diphosphate-sugar epimerase